MRWQRVCMTFGNFDYYIRKLYFIFQTQQVQVLVIWFVASKLNIYVSLIALVLKVVYLVSDSFTLKVASYLNILKNISNKNLMLTSMLMFFICQDINYINIMSIIITFYCNPASFFRCSADVDISSQNHTIVRSGENILLLNP